MMELQKDFHPNLLETAVGAVLCEPAPDDLSPEQIAQLVAVVRQAVDRPCPVTLMQRVKNMRPFAKIAVAASVFIVIVAGLFSWFVPGNGVAVAFADVAEAINGIRTATWKVTMTVQRPDSKSEIVIRQLGMFMMPYKERTETLEDNNVTGFSVFDGQKEKTLSLSLPLKIGVVTDLKNCVGQRPMSPPFVVLQEEIAKAKKGGKDKDKEVQYLGLEVIDGRHTEVFLVRSKVPDTERGSETKLWVDPKTLLPVRVLRTSEGTVDCLMSDFHYDVPLSPDLFSVEAPKSYYVRQLQLGISPTYVAEALGIVAKYSGGYFPPVLTGEEGIDGFMQCGVDDLLKKHGIETAGTWMHRKEETEKFQKLPKEDIEEIQKAIMDRDTTGYLAQVFLDAIGKHGEWHYAGRDVKLNTPDRPIFWYKIGSECKVIYADLSIKEVPAKEMPKMPPSEEKGERKTP